MSSSIWTRCGRRSSLRRLSGRPWRIVESQHLFSTRKLVDSDEEQQVLEELVERHKPPAPAAGPRALHWLLATPLRYPPLSHGSRFGTRGEGGLWYGSEDLETAFAERAYYLFVLVAGSTADLVPLEVDLSAFQAAVRTAHGADLTTGCFAKHAEVIASPTSYAETQRLGAEMRADGVAAFRYPSARDVRRRPNVALFDPSAFSSPTPAVPETWHCLVAASSVEVIKTDVFARRSFVFPRAQFEVAGRLPAPAV